MERYLSTALRYGSFDFISNMIEVSKYDEHSKERIISTLALDINTDEIENSEQIEILSLFYHEITHFLDLTTTTWGLEYISRKRLFVRSVKNEEEDLQPLEVFKLNVSEIEMHKELVKIYNDGIDLLKCTTDHRLIYNEKFGSLIMIDFIYEDIVCSVPLSMLTVLETNAYANEVLIKIKCLEKIEDKSLRITELRALEEKFKSFLKDNEFLEYNLILILAKKHFPELTLKELLLFLRALISKVLNLSGPTDISMISAFIKRTFGDEHIGNAIVKDMQRGMSRQTVVFKFILLIFQYLNSKEQGFIFNEISILKENPFLFIDNFIKEGINIEHFDSDTIQSLECDVYLEKFYNDDIDCDRLLLESIVHNRTVLEEKRNDVYNINEFKLFDIFLSDSTIIKVPNRVECDIESYFDNNMVLFGKVDTLFKTSEMFKFHIHPDEVTLV